MARPLSHPVISVSYDPYSYYRPACGEHDRFIHTSCGAARPASSYHSRPPSIWSTSSICSNDSSLDLALDDRAHDFDEDDALVSPAESSSSRTSWSSVASSSSSASRSSPTEQARSDRFKRSNSVKPRGPRPLPALPISQPSSPYSMPSSLPMTLPLKATPPLRLNLKLLTPPPSYEEAISAGVRAPSPVPVPLPDHERERRPPSCSDPFPYDAEMEVDVSAAEFLTSPAEETLIDWERIEDFIARCDG